MKLQFGNILLSDGLIEAVSGVTYDGQQINDAFDFVRAASRSFAARSRTRSITFAVARSFNSIHLAERALLEHFEQLPTQADLNVHIGSDADGEWVKFADAVLDDVRSTYIGTSPAFEYSFSVVAPQFSQPPPDYTEPTSSMTQRGKESIPNAATGLSVVFATPFATIPVIASVNVGIPPSGQRIFAFVVAGSESTTGFDVEFSAAMPSGAYKLNWEAMV